MLNVPPPDERLKKSAAYQHTMFFGVGLDNGKQYQKRVCSYCTAVFSFKGGTTSAALRHLKTAHPECLQSPSGSTSTTAAASADPPPQQQQPQLDTHTVQRRSNKTTKSPRTAAKPQPASKQSAVPASMSTDAAQPAVAELSTSSVASPSTPAALFTPALQVSDSATGAALVTTEATSAPVEALAPEPIQQQQQQPHRQASSTRKRRRSDPDNDTSSLTPVSTSPTSSTPVAATAAAVAPDDIKPIVYAPLPPTALTSSQTAITHFLEHYKELLTPPSRLRFVKHLTHHVSEAEMYNVLDEATQLEFIKEFADQSTTI